MKFYSHSNENNNYTKAISLTDVRMITLSEGSGKSQIRFSVCITFNDGTIRSFDWLHEEEAKKVYQEILNLLNEDA